MTPIYLKEQVHQMMNSLGAEQRRKQALLQSYYGVSLPDYPSLAEAGLTDEDGYFLVAGERVKLLQHQAVDKVRKIFKENTQSLLQLTDSENIFDSLISEFADDQDVLLFLKFIRAICEDKGEYIDAPQSRT
jgi:hypothetical protein